MSTNTSPSGSKRIADVYENNRRSVWILAGLAATFVLATLLDFAAGSGSAESPGALNVVAGLIAGVVLVFGAAFVLALLVVQVAKRL